MQTDQPNPKSSLMTDILGSFFSLPRWVVVWMLVILGPVNMAAVFFIHEPGGPIIASLVFAGVFLSLLSVPFERGLSKLTAVGHLLPWTILIAYIVFAAPEGSATYEIYLTVLAIVNGISLVFDYMDSLKWVRGDRQVVRSVAQ
jgi:hypothetical protein